MRNSDSSGPASLKCSAVSPIMSTALLLFCRFKAVLTSFTETGSMGSPTFFFANLFYDLNISVHHLLVLLVKFRVRQWYG